MPLSGVLCIINNNVGFVYAKAVSLFLLAIAELFG